MSVERMQARATLIVGRKLDKLGRATGFELLGRLMRATPVDTGRARGNWNASVDRPDASTVDERRAPQALTEGSARIEAFRLSKAGTGLYVTNGLPYIARLNDGWSRQAPAGYVQATVRGMRGFVARTAQRLRHG